MNVAYRVDPQLPAIPATDIACPGCRQTLEVIRDGGRDLPERHYPRPTQVRNSEIVVATIACGGQAALCRFTDDHLYAVVFVEQRNRAALAVAS